MPQNNFNMVRLLAAAAVLWSHCYPIALGDSHHDPLHGILGLSVGRLSVDIFFVASGYLIAGSLFRSKSIVQFAINRGLRIFPGLWVCLGFTVFLYMATTVHANGWKNSGAEAFSYFLSNAPLISANLDFSLKGWFETNILKYTVNGSLWTLPWEVRMYFLLAVVAFPWPKIRSAAIPALCAAFAIIEYNIMSQKSADTNPTLLAVVSRFVYFFFSGATIQLLPRKWHPGAPHGFFLLLAGIALTIINGTLPYFYYMAAIPLIAIGIGLSWWDTPFLKEIANKDISYGLYLYAFPIQQTFIALIPGLQPMQLFLMAAPVTAFCAYISYRFVEHPALKYKETLSATWLKFRKIR